MRMPPPTGCARQFSNDGPDVVVAGPAFNAGRYGLACGLVCKVAQDAGIPAVTSMFEENPGVLSYRNEVLIAAGAEDVKGMEPALSKPRRTRRETRQRRIHRAGR